MNIPVKELIKKEGHPYPEELEIEDWDDIILIQDKKENFDAEKGFIDHEIIVQRVSDQKYFKFTYTEFGFHGDNMADKIAVEVTRKEKVTYYYE